MKVVATKIGQYAGRLFDPGEEFELVEIKGKKMDEKTGKLVDHVFTVESQLSSTWMQRLDAGGGVVVVPSVDYAPPKKKGRPFSVKVENNDLEVI